MQTTAKNLIQKIKKDTDLPSKETVKEWVNEITNSVSELPHYLENKTFNRLRQEIEDVLRVNSIVKNPEIMEKLDGYRYVDEIHELFRGKFIRWIRINNNKASLTNGAMVMDIKFLKEEIQILCRNGANRFIQFKFDECLVFQKLTDEEWLLLSVKSKI